MKNLIVSTFIIVTNIYVTNADQKSKSLVIIDYSNNTEDVIVINKDIANNADKIWQIIEPIIDKRLK